MSIKIQINNRKVRKDNNIGLIFNELIDII